MTVMGTVRPFSFFSSLHMIQDAFSSSFLSVSYDNLFLELFIMTTGGASAETEASDWFEVDCVLSTHSILLSFSFPARYASWANVPRQLTQVLKSFVLDQSKVPWILFSLQHFFLYRFQIISFLVLNRPTMVTNITVLLLRVPSQQSKHRTR